MSADPSVFVASALDLVSWICLVIGSLFCLIGGIGMLRMPDFYTRGHAAGVTDTLGAGLILLGLMFQAGFGLVAVKLAMVLFFLFVTSPTSTHALFKSAYAKGVHWDLSRDAAHAAQSNETAGGTRDGSG
ncbi:MAG: monovalent cation/H(+) antiporter subunit G [Myxococcales bacterium]|nr:monovalent cation/H(+) antiporter subunit G [Myxococcales bacterium]